MVNLPYFQTDPYHMFADVILFLYVLIQWGNWMQMDAATRPSKVSAPQGFLCLLFFNLRRAGGERSISCWCTALEQFCASNEQEELQLF